MGQRACAADGVVHRQGIGAVEDQCRIVDDGPGAQCAGGGGVAYLERTATDGGGANGGIGAGQCFDIRATLQQRTRPADGIGHCLVSRSVKQQQTIIADTAGAQIAAVTDFESALRRLTVEKITR